MSVLFFLVQWLHILAAAFWFGSAMAVYFIMLPVLLQRPPAESRVAFPQVVGRMARLGPIAGQATFWLGLIRGTVYGPIKSFADLFGTPYGHTFMTAIVLTVIAIVNGAMSGKRVEKQVWDGDQYRPGASAAVRNGGLVKLVLFGLIIACMVMMRFGA